MIIWVAGNTVSADLGPGLGLSAEQHRQRFGAPDNGFRVILVGKYGGTKLSRPTPLPSNVLFGAIDAKPMRHDEMRRSR